MNITFEDRAGLYVPKPYPDELLYSLFGRFNQHLRIESPKQMLEMLFGNRTVVASPDFQGQLGRLDWLFEKRWRLSCEEAVMKYTLLPYYVANRPPNDRRKFTRTMVSESGSSVHTALGVCATSIRMPEHFRFCAKCAQDNINQYGEPYWHRAHQLPGVIVCPTHGEPLSLSEVPIRPRGRHEFIPLTRQILKNPVGHETIPEGNHSTVWLIAKCAYELLDVGLNDEAGLSWKDLRNALESLGYDSRHGSIQQLERDFIAYFGRELLSLIDSGFEKYQSLGWLRAIRRKPKRYMHPIRQLLLEVFIQNQIKVNETEPFGKGPWPCHNSLAKHYKKAVVTDMKIFGDKRHPDRILGRFTCCCGFIYSHRADQYPVEKPYRVIEHGPLFRKEAEDLLNRGYKINAIANLLDIDWKTAKRFVSPDEKNISDDMFKKDKAAWLTLLKNNPGVGVKELRRRNPALYMRLYRHEREWLRENSPSALIQKYKNSRCVDWHARDLEISAQVIVSAHEIKMTCPPKRITRTRIANDLGYRALFGKKLHKLPETHKLLMKIEESPQDFRLRRLRVAFKRLEPGVTKSALLHAARIRKAYVCDEVLAEIKQLQPKLVEGTVINEMVS